MDLLEKALLSLFENSVMRPHDKEYVKGEICVALYEINKKWYRGRVTEVNIWILLIYGFNA